MAPLFRLAEKRYCAGAVTVTGKAKLKAPSDDTMG